MTAFRDRYPPPWRAEEIAAPGYKVVDAQGNDLCFLYADDGRQEVNVRFRMSMREAKALAEAICSLAERS